VTVVADSSPLVILTKLSCFDLLNQVFARVYISPEVHASLFPAPLFQNSERTDCDEHEDSQNFRRPVEWHCLRLEADTLCYTQTSENPVAPRRSYCTVTVTVATERPYWFVEYNV
jgi:hypothetical protein